MSAARPLVQVFSADPKAAKEQIKVPSVLLSPIRQDIVQFVHTNVAKNARQPYAVARNAGEQTSAQSWGTGRARARIPRVSGGGTHRSGQGAFGNMCRGGRMYAPTRIWRKWHKKVNLNQRRYAICSALAASAVPALVMARGHRIENVPEVPLVVSNAAIETIDKTKDAVSLLAALGADADVQRVKDSRRVRAGKGKLRNRRFVQRRGPLVIYNNDSPLTRSFRNIPGVELCSVQRLNLLQLAPGGHLGRFIIWVKDAFERLDSLYGGPNQASEEKVNYHAPRNIMSNSDLSRLINSDEIQSALKPAQSKKAPFVPRKRNPLKNLGAMAKLNPAAISQRRRQLVNEQSKKAREVSIAKKRKDRKKSYDTSAFVKTLLSD